MEDDSGFEQTVKSGGDLTQSVVVGDVSCQSTDERGRASILVELSKQLGSRGQVGGPTKPACVTCIQVHVYTSSVQLFDSVGYASLQVRLSARHLNLLYISRTLYAACAPEHLATLRLVTRFARESGSMTATTRTSGYSGRYDTNISGS